MKPLTPLLFMTLLTVADHAVAQPKVEATGITAKVKLEEVISGGRFGGDSAEAPLKVGGHRPA